ncbi:MAG TPA: DsrE family protein [Burkholderiaceae bacterium]|jgi:intracellular sulfur oxidation DsrE/DsrF family protein|nr:DsrE family protein [Burkholderiaceae bacterium]
MTPSRRAPRLLAAALLALAGELACAAGPAPVPQAVAAAPAESAREQAIFAVTDDDAKKWNLTLGNIGNAIDGIGANAAEIELVVYGPGIAMLKKDSPVADKIAAAQAMGVRIVACQNSMRAFHLEPADLAPGVGSVPSGVVELIRRQHAGYAYVRS